MPEKFITIENAGDERPMEQWSVDAIAASFTNQAEDVCELSFKGRRYDAAFLFAYKSEVIVRYDRIRDDEGQWTGGTRFFSGIVVEPHAGATGRSEFQGCQLCGPGWFLNELGFEQEFRKLVSLELGVPTYANPNPTKSRIILNQKLGEYGIPSFEKLTTGHPISFARWHAAGRPLHTEAQYFARKGVCAGCFDEKCAACPATELSRWLPTEDCPLCLWPNVPVLKTHSGGIQEA